VTLRRPERAEVVCRSTFAETGLRRASPAADRRAAGSPSLVADQPIRQLFALAQEGDRRGPACANLPALPQVSSCVARSAGQRFVQRRLEPVEPGHA
jgi:hypothetical protein